MAESKRLAEKARCEELPLLSEEAQAQYKGWWAGFRKRSVSFGSLNDGSTGSSRDDLEGPAAPAAPAVAATPAAATATATPAHPLPADLPTSASLSIRIRRLQSCQHHPLRIRRLQSCRHHLLRVRWLQRCQQQQHLRFRLCQHPCRRIWQLHRLHVYRARLSLCLVRALGPKWR